MKTTNITYSSECDHCHRTFESEEKNRCPSQADVTEFFLGLDKSSMIYGSKYGLELGDLCGNCRSLAFDTIKKVFPEARMVTIND